MMTNLIHIPVSMNKLSEWSAQRGMRTEAGPDIRRVLHHLVDECFGQSVLKPFRMYTTSGTAALYGYCSTPCSDLIETSQIIACPDTLAVLDVSKIREKKMPSEWQSGKRIGFDVCTIPVRRAAGSNKEIDTYIRDVNKWKDSKDSAAPSREESYLTWLDERFGGAADIVREVTNFRAKSVATKRKGEVIRRTEATFQGDLIIKDPQLFAEKIAGGIGRHKSYGYGMIILRGANNRRAQQA
jgi:CRISPR system Cascade subunit CasE